MRQTIATCAAIEVGDTWYSITGIVYLGSTGPGGDDPTEVDEWDVDECSRAQLIDAIYERTTLTREECREQVERVLVEEARNGDRGIA